MVKGANVECLDIRLWNLTGVFGIYFGGIKLEFLRVLKAPQNALSREWVQIEIIQAVNADRW